MMAKKILFLLFFCINVFPMNLPQINEPVEDFAKIISPKVVKELNYVLRDTYKKGIIQLQIVTIPSLKGNPVEEYSIQLANQIKLGKEGKDNGVLFLISLSDRQMRIEVGSGAEGFLTDLETSIIIEEVKAHFKNKDFDNGILYATNQILKKAKIETKSDLINNYNNYKSGFVIYGFFIFILLMLILVLTGHGDIAWLIITSISNNKSSGTRWKGGGGGFSGGGSSGKW